MNGKNRDPQNDKKRDDDPQDDDPQRDIKDPPVHDEEPDPTEPEGDPKPSVPPMKVAPSAGTSTRESINLRNRRTCNMCGKLFLGEADLVDHEITVHPNVKSASPATHADFAAPKQ
jgi:hypothetical protein